MFSKNLQLSYYKKNFQPQKFSLYISELLNNKSRVSWSLFIKHNSIKSETYFNPTHIYSIFSRIHVFQGPNFFGQYFSRSGFSGSRFIRVWVQGPGPGLRSSTLYLHGNHSSASRCSPVSLLHISEHLFTRTPLKDCFCKI